MSIENIMKAISDHDYELKVLKNLKSLLEKKKEPDLNIYLEAIDKLIARRLQ